MKTRIPGYDEFKSIADRGRAAILAAKDVGTEPESLQEVVDDATQALLSTDYGQRLSEESALESALAELEYGLEILRQSVHPSTANITDALADAEESERAFLYWIRLGEIYHYFRDQGRYLDSAAEELERLRIRNSIDTLNDQLQSLLGHVTVQVFYDRPVLSEAKKLINRLHKMQGVLRQRPLEELYSTIDGDSPDPANPFHGGAAIIRNEFVMAVSMMGFELFGHMPPRLVGEFLRLKSETAEALGLQPWPEEMDDTKLRSYIRKALTAAKRLAKSRKWPMTDVINFYADNRELLSNDPNE